MADSVHEDLTHEAAWGEMSPNLYNPATPVSPQGPQTPQVTNDPHKDFGGLIEQLYDAHKRDDTDGFQKQLDELVNVYQRANPR
jgi:hypothetical protein